MIVTGTEDTRASSRLHATWQKKLSPQEEVEEVEGAHGPVQGWPDSLRRQSFLPNLNMSAHFLLPPPVIGANSDHLAI